MKKQTYAILAIGLALLVSIPARLYAKEGHSYTEGNSYIDQIGQVIAQDVKHQKEMDKRMNAVKLVVPTNTTAGATTQPLSGVTTTTPDASSMISTYNRQQDYYDEEEFALFFANLFGQDEFVDDFLDYMDFEDDVEDTGSYNFGDSVRNPTFKQFSGARDVIGRDISYTRPMYINDDILRSGVVSSNYSLIGQRLFELGYGRDFRVESQQ